MLAVDSLDAVLTIPAVFNALERDDCLPGFYDLTAALRLPVSLDLDDGIPLVV